jgi:hypothetical protein
MPPPRSRWPARGRERPLRPTQRGWRPAAGAGAPPTAAGAGAPWATAGGRRAWGSGAASRRRPGPGSRLLPRQSVSQPVSQSVSVRGAHCRALLGELCATFVARGVCLTPNLPVGTVARWRDMTWPKLEPYRKVRNAQLTSTARQHILVDSLGPQRWHSELTTPTLPSQPLHVSNVHFTHGRDPQARCS